MVNNKSKKKEKARGNKSNVYIQITYLLRESKPLYHSHNRAPPSLTICM